jgi:peptidoglycan/LPS O-acetylase OafA/YrhL
MRPKNNFDSLRILAALAVVASHSFPLSYGSNQQEPIHRLSGGQTNAGTIAVSVFFIISGYLITQSFERSRGVRTFLISRALRLLPGLAMVLIVLAFVIGPIVSAVSVHEYFCSWQPYRFVAINLSLFDTAYNLPGVFLGNPWPDAVDGSLWTLRYEARCYLMVLFLGVSGVLTRLTTLGLLFAGCLAMKFWSVGALMDCYTCFAAGAVLYLWRPPFAGWIASLCSLLWLASLLIGGFRIATPLVGAYVIIYLALAAGIKFPNLARWGDLS